MGMPLVCTHKRGEKVCTSKKQNNNLKTCNMTPDFSKDPKNFRKNRSRDGFTIPEYQLFGIVKNLHYSFKSFLF